MADARFFIDSLVTVGPDLYLVVAPVADLHHMVNVVRLEPGERIEVVERSGWTALSAIVAEVSSGTEPRVALREPTEITRDTPPFSVDLAFGLAKGDTTDTVVRQAVELGVNGVLPVTFERSVVRLTGDKVESRRQRLQKVAEAAAKQSHRSLVPEVVSPEPFAKLLERMGDYHLKLVAWEEATDNDLTNVVRAAFRDGQLAAQAGVRGRVLVVIGPEGGISRREAELLSSGGGMLVSLGPSILRVDTAAAVGLGLTFDALRHAISATE